MVRKFFIGLVISLGIVSLRAQSVEESIMEAAAKMSYPQSVADFKTVFHFPPVNQDTTNVCWSFATVSFMETEMQRLGKKPVKLSVMYPVYWAFVEKAKYFVRTRGMSRFKAGDLFTTVLDMVKQYGIVPESVYRGQAKFCPTFNHEQLEAEVERYSREIKENNLWDEPTVVAGIKSILDKYLGTPPGRFEFNGKIMTPEQFAREYVDLPWQDYIAVTSFLYEPFDRFIVLDVPDNWRHVNRFFNVPLALFYRAIKAAISRGFSLVIDGDISEPGRFGPGDICFIPDFDIPSAYINQQARELRFKQKSTTDDHLMQLVGYLNVEDADWFLEKDSWRDAWQGKNKGYFIFSGDFIKLKVLAYLVHKDALADIIKLIPETVK